MLASNIERQLGALGVTTTSEEGDDGDFGDLLLDGLTGAVSTPTPRRLAGDGDHKELQRVDLKRFRRLSGGVDAGTARKFKVPSPAAIVCVWEPLCPILT